MTLPEVEPSRGEDRRILIAVTLIVFALIPLQIIASGYLPTDDALRHAGKAVSGKPWEQLILMRPGMVDFSPGWHAFLRGIHVLTGANAHTLLVVEIALLFLLFSLPGIVLLRRPEAWMAAITIAAVLEPQLEMRLIIGRPLVFAMAILVTMCLTWRTLDTERLSRSAFAAFAAMIAASTWIHGSFYLWALPVLACVVAGQRRVALRLAGATAAGWVVGALLSGHPVAFLRQTLELGMAVGGGRLAASIYEMKPYPFATMLILVVPILVIARKLWLGAPVLSLRRDPVFVLAALGWVLGMKAGRFWMDWGTPALVVWMAREIEALWEAHAPRANRLAVVGALGLACFMVWTANVNDRWVPRRDRTYETILEPQFAAALPDSGGMIYSDDRRAFYDLLYQRPNAPWRYAVAYEPEVMPEEDYAVYAGRVNGQIEALEPWVRKLRPEDRMFLRFTNGMPPFPSLQWDMIPGGLWVGRTRR